MRVQRFDERGVLSERTGTSFVVFVYEGGDPPGTSWSVDSYLLDDADLPGVLGWLGKHLPPGCCWSLGVARPLDPSPAATGMAVDWIVGADVLNAEAGTLSPAAQRVAREMLGRRHRVGF